MRLIRLGEDGVDRGVVMRTKDVLIDVFEDIKILCQYLYMSEDHKVKIHNAIGVPLELYMDDNLQIMCKNLNFPDIPPMYYSNNMHPDGLWSLVEALKEEPAEEYAQHFQNRWEEIKNICRVNLSLNIKD